MAITSTGLDASVYADTAAKTATAAVDKTALGKDDFMKLLLVQLQYQDPTEPMDAEKILTQTSQLAGLEASTNTKTALDALTAKLGTSDQFSTIAAIGKRADLGSDAIQHDKGSSSAFEMYFPEEVSSGTIEISDADGNVVSTMNILDAKDVDGNPITKRDPGVYQFNWSGEDAQGNQLEGGIYHVNATYLDPTGTTQTSRVGAYPIESVRFENGEALVKLGSSYIPLNQVVEFY
jgi:flagellar basal-body rod modification protein FlgD